MLLYVVMAFDYMQIGKSEFWLDVVANIYARSNISMLNILFVYMNVMLVTTNEIRNT